MFSDRPQLYVGVRRLRISRYAYLLSTAVVCCAAAFHSDCLFRLCKGTDFDPIVHLDLSFFPVFVRFPFVALDLDCHLVLRVRSLFWRPR